MKKKEFRSQRLMDALDKMDETMLISAHSIDTPEKFRALDSARLTSNSPGRQVSNTRRYLAAAACLAIALTIAFSAFFFRGLQDPGHATQPPVASSATAPTDPNRIVGSGTYGSNLFWTVDENGLLTISGTGEMEVLNDWTPWMDHKICHLVVEEGVTSIAPYLFSGYNTLLTVSLPGSVTTIGQNAFHSCREMTELKLSPGLKEIQVGAFGNCRSLPSVTVPQGVETIGSEAFAQCISLEEAVLPESLTGLGPGAFRDCKSLLRIDIPSGVAAIGQETFAGCTQLRKARLSYGVTTICERAFANCENLRSIFLPATLQMIDKEVFDGCNNLDHVYFQGSWKQWENVGIITNTGMVFGPDSWSSGNTNEELICATTHARCSRFCCVGTKHQLCTRCLFTWLNIGSLVLAALAWTIWNRRKNRPRQ